MQLDTAINLIARLESCERATCGDDAYQTTLAEYQEAIVRFPITMARAAKIVLDRRHDWLDEPPTLPAPF
jgi:hypothetical protein